MRNESENNAAADDSNQSQEYSSNDVLTLKGTHAQHTTHTGNLIFYKLCEERFDQFNALSPSLDSARRQKLAWQVVREIQKKGGVFRHMNGKVMEPKRAVIKTIDRLRQIQKPKFVPPATIGNNDVVFKRGAANHVYPGNAKYKTLLESYVPQYWPDLVPQIKLKAKDNEGDENRQHKLDRRAILDLLIGIIHSRGGQFRGGNDLKILRKQDVAKKIHERFRDLRKQIQSGKVYSNNWGSGCTSKKITVPHGSTTKSIFEQEVFVVDSATPIHKETKAIMDKVFGEMTREEKGRFRAMDEEGKENFVFKKWFRDEEEKRSNVRGKESKKKEGEEGYDDKFDDADESIYHLLGTAIEI
jgi:hypothetical protein